MTEMRDYEKMESSREAFIQYLKDFKLALENHINRYRNASFFKHIYYSIFYNKTLTEERVQIAEQVITRLNTLIQNSKPNNWAIDLIGKGQELDKSLTEWKNMNTNATQTHANDGLFSPSSGELSRILHNYSIALNKVINYLITKNPIANALSTTRLK